jgi:hypothetical protein
MKVAEFLTYVQRTEQLIGREALRELDLCFETTVKGKPAYVFPNICTFYQEDQMLVLRLRVGSHRFFTPAIPQRGNERMTVCEASEHTVVPKRRGFRADEGHKSHAMG